MLFTFNEVYKTLCTIDVTETMRHTYSLLFDMHFHTYMFIIIFILLFYWTQLSHSWEWADLFALLCVVCK